MRGSSFGVVERSEVESGTYDLHRAKGTPLPDEWAGLDELELK